MSKTREMLKADLALTAEALLCLSLFGPQPLAWLYLAEQLLPAGTGPGWRLMLVLDATAVGTVVTFYLARKADDVRAQALARTLAVAVDVPVSVDLENGYGPEPERAADAIAGVAAAGAVGGSIEDWDPGDERIYELEHAAERVAAACEAAGRLDFPFLVTARAENHFRGNPDLDDTIARLQAFERAGANVLYAPGLRTVDEIRAVCAATSKPVNVIARPKISFADMVEAGAQRVSVGSSLAFVALAAMAEAAEAIRDDGDFGPITFSPRLMDWLKALD